MEFDKERLKKIMHYVIASAGDRDGFGAIKLYKVLWFSEGRIWLLTGRVLTGATYIREKFGPVPKQGLRAKRELVKEGKIREWSEPYYNTTITRFKNLQPADISGIDKDDLKTIDYWIKHIDEDHTASSISEESHDLAWEIAELGEELPLYSFLTTRIRESTPDEKNRAFLRLKKRRRI